ncbi:MAG: hypothetical protein HY716_10440 [Planctomycetes bacterium]|nr:hypothetical protein [Planctomycetota bacterium]
MGRTALAVWLLFLLAVLNVFLEARGMELEYELAAARRRLQAEALEHREMMLAVEAERHPASLRRRARALSARFP